MVRRPADLDTVRALVREVEGWLTDAQIARLHDAARRAPADGRIVEIGSFRGRSTIVLASSALPSVEVIAIDPHAGNDRGPQEIEGFADAAREDNAVFEENLRRAGVRDSVVHHREFSDRAHRLVDDPIDVLFVDGAHRFAPARADIRDWGGRVSPGGRMLVHDSFSSVGVTAALLVEQFGSARWRYEGRAGSLAEYVRVDQRGLARARDVIRQSLQLVWFVRNVTIKVLLVAKLGPVARALGHRQDAFPY